MGIKNILLRTANHLVCIFGVFQQKLPVFYRGHILWLHKNSWESLYSRYEPYMAKTLEENLKNGDTFFDVGSNKGWFSLLASKIVGPHGKVFAFEPAPEVFELLKNNTKGVQNIKPTQAGVGSINGKLTFASQGTSSAGSFVENVTKINEQYLKDIPILGVDVPICTLDSLIQDLGTIPNLIKIDVEGFELEVLKGAKNLLGTHTPKIIMEIHPKQLQLSGGSEEQVFNILSENKYTWTIIDKNPNSLYTILAKAPS